MIQQEDYGSPLIGPLLQHSPKLLGIWTTTVTSKENPNILEGIYFTLVTVFHQAYQKMVEDKIKEWNVPDREETIIDRFFWYLVIGIPLVVGRLFWLFV